MSQTGYGNASSELDRCRDIDVAGEGSLYQIHGDEGSTASLKYLPLQDHGRGFGINKQQNYSSGISRKIKRDSVSGHVQTGSRGHCFVRAVCGHHLSKVHSGKEHSQGLAKPPRSGLFLLGCSTTFSRSSVFF